MSTSLNWNDRNWSRLIPLQKCLEEFGSPTYVASLPRLKKNVEDFTGFTGSPERIYYPVKANPTFAVLRALADQGVGADCSSIHEVNLARWAGIPWNRILYTSPVTDLKYALRLLKTGATVIIDNEADLRALDSMIHSGDTEVQPTGKVFVRLNPETKIEYSEKADYQDLTAHASHSSKFGIPSEDLLQATDGIKLRISGLHLHVGTQMDHLDSFRAGLQTLHSCAELLLANGHPVRTLDLGGGLGIAFGPEDRFPSIKEYTSSLLPLCDPTRFDYAVEPGHALIGDAVCLLTQILKIKPSRGKTWGVIDVGTEQLAKVSLLKWQHRVLTENGELPWTGTDVLAGPLCFAGDTLLHQTNLSSLKEGDPLCIRDAGAYCFALSNHFNGRYAPGMVLIDENGVLIRAHEPESPALDTSIQSWVGFTENRESIASHPEWKTQDALLQAQEFYQLGSSYLWHLAAADQYKITEVYHLGPQEFLVQILTRAAVPFISAPFALRMIGDASIMASLRVLGLTLKSAPVWGRMITLECRDQIASGTTLPCRLSLSHPLTGISSGGSIWVRFDLADGKFVGQIELVF